MRAVALQLALLLLGVQAAVHAQAPESTFWLHAGVGGVARESLDGAAPAGIVGGAWQRGASVYSLRWAMTEELVLFGGERYPLDEIAILYGRGTRPGAAHATASIGIAWVGGERRAADSQLTEDVSTIGLPVELQLSLRPLAFLGVGIYGLANWNRSEPFAGGTIFLQLGRLR